MDDWDLEAPKAKQAAGPAASEPAATAGDAGSDAAAPGTAATSRSAAAAPPETAAAAPSVSRPAAAAPQPAEPPQLLQRSRRSRVVRLLPFVAGALVLLLIGALAGFFIARSQNQTAADELAQARERLGLAQKGLADSEERNWNYYRENEALKAQIEELQNGQNGGGPSSTTTTVPGAPATFTDGIFLVGDDITPGDYDGVPTGQVGYWARLRGTDGVIGAIVANGLVTGPFVLTINSSDVAVELRGVKLTSR